MRKYIHGLYKRQFLQLPVVILLAVVGSCQQPENQMEKSSENPLSTFELDPEFQIELLVSEPLVADPVAMEIDEYGRLYVVEMHGYPLDKSGTGMVKLLTDSNGDGQLDKSTVFAEGLMLPTGIMRWKNGILVTDPPNVLYLEDSNGDGKADIRNIMLTGFAVSNPQHNVNNPLLGIDNWIYLGHEQAVTAQIYKDEFGDPGSDIFYPSKEDSPRLPENARGRSVRFRPDQYQLETLSANTQFGHTFDVWGHHLMVSNANHIYHEVIAAPYLNRRPDLLISDARQSISDHGTAAEVYPITKNPEHQLLTDLGVFTSACGITAYTGGIFPEAFENAAFVAEPVSNLVHVDLVKDKGATFSASRMYEEKEFLASTDAWFRPVNMYIGPDGALYVVDYYRQFIEHPEWMAEEVVKSGGLYTGMDKGRIYRITPKGEKPAKWANEVKLGDATNEKLVELLAHQNIWWRRNAQRLLLDRNNNKEVVPALERMVTDSNPYGRLHALYTLEGLNALKPEQLKKALQDPVPGIRENAIKLAEPFLKAEPGLAVNLLELQDDDHDKVRFQLLCTLGFIHTPEAARARENLLFKDIEDPWMQVAALTAPSLQEIDLLQAVIERYDKEVPAYASLVQRLSSITGATDPYERLRPLIHQATRATPDERDAWQAPVLVGLAEGMKNRKDSFDKLETEKKVLLKASFDHPASSVRQASLQLLKVTGLPEGKGAEAALQKAAKIALNTSSIPEKRIEAIQLLSLGKSAQHEELFKSMIVPHEPLSLQLAAMQALSDVPGQGISHYLLDRWEVLTPDLREAALNSFLVNEDRISLLLDAIEKKQIDPASIGWRRSVRLMSQSDKKLRDRARVLLTQKDEERNRLIAQYQPALTLAGDLDKGKVVFQKSCSMCHQMAGKEGVSFGPDLGTIRNRRPENILADILDPNLSIADGHDLWLIELHSGESIQGLIATETPTALTLRNYGGEEITIARSNIKSLKALGMSAMPTGLEKQISHQEMADLLVYLKNAR